MKPEINYVAIAVDAMRETLAEVRRARSELDHMVLVHGPVAILRAARIGMALIAERET